MTLRAGLSEAERGGALFREERIDALMDCLTSDLADMLMSDEVDFIENTADRRAVRGAELTDVEVERLTAIRAACQARKRAAQ